MDDLQEKEWINLQGGSHREVERHMPSAALFKVKATNLSFYASATEGMTKTKNFRRWFPNSFAPLEISRKFKCPPNQQLNWFQNFSFCNCPGNRKIKYIKLSNTNKNVKSILVRCDFPLDGSLAFPSIEDNKLNESLKPLNHQHNARNTKYMSFSYRVNEMQLFLSLPTPRWIVEISAFGRRKNNCLFQSVTRLPQK